MFGVCTHIRNRLPSLPEEQTQTNEPTLGMFHLHIMYAYTHIRIYANMLFCFTDVEAKRQKSEEEYEIVAAAERTKLEVKRKDEEAKTNSVISFRLSSPSSIADVDDGSYTRIYPF